MAQSLFFTPNLATGVFGIASYSDSNYRTTILGRSSLVGYWRMNAERAAFDNDESGHGLDATVAGGVTFNQPGAICDGDESALLNGSTGEFTVSSALTVTNACSFEAWLFDTSGALSDLKGIISLNFGSDLFLMTSTKKLQLSLALSSGQKNIAGSATLVANRWNHVVATFDGADVITLYINGVQDSQTSGLAGTLSAVPAVTRHIGSDSNGVAARFWQGRLDEVAVYNAALTATQVATNFATANGRPGVWGGGV